MDKIFITIVNPKHPHYPKKGYVEVKNGKVQVKNIYGIEMFNVKFEDGLHGMAAYSDCKLEKNID